MAVSSTKGTTQQKGEGHALVYPLNPNRDSDSKKNPMNSKIVSTESSPFDRIELSSPAQKILQKVSKNTQDLLKKYPQFKHLISDLDHKGKQNSLSYAIASITQTRFFLTNPSIQSRREEDPEFAKFYQEIDSLMKANQKAVKEAQEEIRTAKTFTYHKFFRR